MRPRPWHVGQAPPVYWASRILRTKAAVLSDSRPRANAAYAADWRAWSHSRRTTASWECRAVAGARPQGVGRRCRRLPAPPFDGTNAAHRATRTPSSDAALRHTEAKRQRRLSRAGHPGKHDQAVARNVYVHVLQIVLARATHAYETLPPRSGIQAIRTLFSCHLASSARCALACPYHWASEPHQQLGRFRSAFWTSSFASQ
jgi:hypothetical protein